LDCEFNSIINLDNLPKKLEKLYCGHNSITHLDNLPPDLKELKCNNKLKSMKHIPKVSRLEYIANPIYYLFQEKIKEFELTLFSNLEITE
jgi:hypothetical protein